MYDSWDIVRDRCYCHFSIWAIFCAFTPSPPSPHLLKAKKINIFEKMKKAPGDIIIWQMCTRNYGQMMYGSWDMLCDRWTDRQTNVWKKWNIEVGSPPKNILNYFKGYSINFPIFMKSFNDDLIDYKADSLCQNLNLNVAFFCLSICNRHNQYFLHLMFIP